MSGRTGRTIVIRACGVMVSLGLLADVARAQNQGPPAIPGNATVLEGTPTVRVEVSQEGARRRMLSPTEAAAETLSIRVKDGRMFWASQGDRPLTLTSAGDMTYLSSAEPGRYVRLRRINDKLTYVEHLDMGSRSVTYWGELRVVLAK
jgi:hypothetical protein